MSLSMSKPNNRKNKKIKRKSKKFGLYILGIGVLIILIWLLYYYVRFYSYDVYKEYLSSYDYEEGRELDIIPETNPSVKGMKLIAENKNLKLYTNTETAEVAVYDKRNQTVMYSNPVDADKDPIANETNKRYMKSQFILNYFNKSRAAGVYDSYSMSVAKGQIEAEGIKDGIRYIYNVGDFSTRTTGNIPIFITTEKIEEIQAKLPENDAIALRRYYSDSNSVPGMLELNGVVQKNKITLQKIEKYLQDAGFTEDDYYEQMELAGRNEEKEAVSFIIPLEYRLEEDGLRVSIPTGEIKEFGGAKIYRIQLHRYMGAAGQDELGYMVVPNGSGSIINFNNGKVNATDYSQYVYNIDPISDSLTQTEYSEPARMALFGICRENSGILVTIEDGAALASITAGIAKKYSSYNFVYPSFQLRGYDVLSLFGNTGNEADLPIVVNDIYDLNLSVKYTLLTDEYSGYNGIANYYRQKLIDKGVLKLMEGNGDIPFYYDIVGGVKETAFFLGTQHLSVNPVTSFEEAGDISDDLLANGIKNQVMNLQGWFNGGYYHDVTDKVRVIRKLGGKSGLQKLNQRVEDNGGSLYGDVAFQEVTYISKRYSYYQETSRYYGAGYYAYFAKVSPTSLSKLSALGYPETGYYLISPKFLPRYVDKFTRALDKIDVGGISLRDLGQALHSDQKRTYFINREEALDVVLGQLEKLSDTGKSLLVSGGNDYAFKYTSDIINAPLSDNKYFVIDKGIPLYQMILHGSIDYSGELINFYDDMDRSELMLKLIENGASPHYIFTNKSANEMKYTGLHNYYSTKYELWKEDAVNIYHYVNTALRNVSGETMIAHEIIKDGINKVTYSNGLVFYIDYLSEDMTVDGVTIPAKNYRIIDR